MLALDTAFGEDRLHLERRTLLPAARAVTRNQQEAVLEVGVHAVYYACHFGHPTLHQLKTEV